MIRRYVSSGRFKPAGQFDDAPLFAALAKHRRPKSAPHCKGWATRRAPVMAKLAVMRDELMAEMVVF